jgi:hypothetical protein
MSNNNPFDVLRNDDENEEDPIEGRSDCSSCSSKSSSSPSIPGKSTETASKRLKSRHSKKLKSRAIMDDTPETWVDTEIVEIAHEPGVPLEERYRPDLDNHIPSNTTPPSKKKTSRSTY